MPHSSRAPAQTALTGFQSAMACIQPGMSAVGTMALDTKASGNRTMKPNDAARLGALGVHAHDGGDPGERVGEEQHEQEAGHRARPGSCVRAPAHDASPVTATITAHSTAVIRSATERPTRTAERHMGRVRKRSIMPSFRSVLRPTAVPMVEVTRFSASRPAMSVVRVAAAAGDGDGRRRRCTRTAT